MLSIYPITTDTKNLDEIRRLYSRAFPRNERRPFKSLIADPRGRAEAVALYDGAQFCGFACLRNGADISHITYFAIEESLRDRGYGSMALRALHEYKGDRRIIVDVERETEAAANNDLRRRRKQFYLRNGYQQTVIRYRWQGEDYEILSCGGNITEEEFDAFWEGAM